MTASCPTGPRVFTGSPEGGKSFFENQQKRNKKEEIGGKHSMNLQYTSIPTHI